MGSYFGTFRENGIVVTVTDQSGQEFVSYYLQKLLLQMGCNVVGEYKVVALEELDQEEVIERIVSNIVKAFSDQEQYISTADLENTFQYLKARFVNADMEQYKDESYEIKYWYDSGMAHGVAGPLVALAKAKRQGIQEMYLEEAIWKLFGLYEELCVENNGIVRYPRRLPIDCYVSKTSADLTENAGWCYGNLGIVRSLMKTAKYLRKPMEYAYYLDKLVDILAQPAKEYNLSSPIVCHGYGSVISIQKYAFLESQDERCLVNLERETWRSH